MKSTTLRRSNITKEKVAMMEALNRYNMQHRDENFYKSQNKTLDMLWQSFGVKPQRNEKSPQVYFISGFVLGIIVTLMVTIILSILINFSTPKNITDAPVRKAKVETSGKFSFVPADTTTKAVETSVAEKSYTVQEGDTLEGIIIRFYGTFDMSKVRLIQEANQMSNPNALSIGQQLVIPMN